MTTGKNSHVKLAQVALMAGVSKSTASAALGGTGRVSDRTRDHVLQVAEQLGYRPNAGARALRVGADPIVALLLRSHMGLMPGETNSLFWPKLLYSMVDELTKAGIGVLVASDQVQGGLNRLPIDAVVSVVSDFDDEILADLPSGIPKLMGGMPVAHPGYSTIGHDHAEITRAAMDHLFEQGSRFPALLVGPSITPIVRTPAAQAYEQWSREHDVEPRFLEADDFAEVGPILSAAAADGMDGVYALTADNLSVYAALTEYAGLRVPEDVLLLGIGGGGIVGPLRPAISVMRLHGAKSGRVVAGEVVRALATGEQVNVLLPYSVQVRNTTTRKGPGVAEPTPATQVPHPD